MRTSKCCRGHGHTVLDQSHGDSWILALAQHTEFESYAPGPRQRRWYRSHRLDSFPALTLPTISVSKWTALKWAAREHVSNHHEKRAAYQDRASTARAAIPAPQPRRSMESPTATCKRLCGCHTRSSWGTIRTGTSSLLRRNGDYGEQGISLGRPRRLGILSRNLPILSKMIMSSEQKRATVAGRPFRKLSSATAPAHHSLAAWLL